MTAYPGHWNTHYGNLQFDYRWLRCTGQDCEPVGYGDTYLITDADEGASLLVEVTAVDAGGIGRARSNPRALMTMRPINLSPPTFIGRQRLGEKLTGQFGSWTSPDGSRISSSFSWQRCEADGTQCVTIPGQPTSGLGAGRHTITLEDIGHRLRVEVGARNDSGVRYAYSGLTEVLALHPPVAVTQPGINGRARVGMALQGYSPRWSYDGLGALHVDFSWQRCDADGARCVTIAGSGARYTVADSDVGHRLRLQVAGETIEGTTYAYSELTEPIERHPPVATAPPTFTGRARLGITLSGRNGDWAYDGAGRIHITFSWQRCEADSSQCVAIAGSDYRHEVTEDDLGHRLRLQVAAETIEGTTYAYSTLTELIERHPPVATAPPTFSGTARLGQTLIGRNGDWAYDGAGPMHITFSWQRCEADGSQCVTIPGQYVNRHTIVVADVGHRLRLQVAAETPDGTTYAYSTLTDLIA